MRHFKAMAASAANSTAFRFSTGSAPGSPEADRHTFVVRRIAKTSRAGAEDFRRGQQLDVDFKSNDRLVFREEIRGKGWSGRHIGRL